MNNWRIVSDFDLKPILELNRTYFVSIIFWSNSWFTTLLYNINDSTSWMKQRFPEKKIPGVPNLNFMYHVSCEPLRIFWNDDTTCSTRVPRVLSTTGWKARNPARSRQHAWQPYRAGCIVFSENPQGLATHVLRVKTILNENEGKE